MERAKWLLLACLATAHLGCADNTTQAEAGVPAAAEEQTSIVRRGGELPRSSFNYVERQSAYRIREKTKRSKKPMASRVKPYVVPQPGMTVVHNPAPPDESVRAETMDLPEVDEVEIIVAPPEPDIEVVEPPNPIEPPIEE